MNSVTNTVFDPSISAFRADRRRVALALQSSRESVALAAVAKAPENAVAAGVNHVSRLAVEPSSPASNAPELMLSKAPAVQAIREPGPELGRSSFEKSWRRAQRVYAQHSAHSQASSKGSLVDFYLG